MNKIKVIIKRPDEKHGHITWISDTLENLQSIVDGYIEVIPLDEDLVMICNEMGKVWDLEENFYLGMIRGTVIIAGVDEDVFADIPERVGMNCWRQMLEVWGN